MKTTLQIDVASFFVPTSAKCTLGENWEHISLENLPPETLAALCDEFRANVFGAAGKEPPPEPRPVSQRAEVFGVLLEIDATIKDMEKHFPPTPIFHVLHTKIAQAVALLQV